MIPAQNSVKNNITPTRSNFETGRILYSNPSNGYYEIIPDTSTSGLDGTIQAIDMRGFDAYGTGTTITNPYPTGTSVIYVSLKDIGKDVPRREAIILGSDKLVPSIKSDSFHPHWAICPDAETIYGDKDIVVSAYTKLQDNRIIHDRSYGTPVDSGEADYIIIGGLKNYIRVGYGVVSLSGSYNNNLNFFSESNGCVFSTGSYYIQDSIFSRKEVYPDYNGSATEINQYAYTIKEGYGSFFGDKLFEKSDTEGEQLYTPETGQFPVYRLQEMQGAICRGKSICVSDVVLKDKCYNITSSEKDILKAGILSNNEDSKPCDDIIQYGVSAFNMPWDGSISLNSLNSITIDKDYFIPHITQIATESNTYLEESSKEVDKAPLSPYSKLEGKALIYSTQIASALYEYSKLGTLRRLFKNALNRVHAWCARKPKEIFESLKLKPNTVLKPLGAAEPCYAIDQVIKRKDAVLDEDGYSLLTALSAFLHVSPSGAIVISDGYGAEIRLEGGNITLSPAGDLKILPGRDVIGIVPGKTEYVSKSRIDIASDNESLSLKSKKDINAVSTKGIIELETLSDSPLSIAGDDAWEGSSIILKSSKGVSISGDNISIRRQALKDEAIGRSETSPGCIIIDANNGSLLTYGNSIINRAVSDVTIAGKSSAITVAGIATIYSASLTLPGTVSIVGTPSSKLTVPSITNKGIVSEVITIPSSPDGTLIVDGNCVISEGLLAQDALISNMGIGRCRIAMGGVDNASDLSGLKVDKEKAGELDLQESERETIAGQASALARVIPDTTSNTTDFISAVFSSSAIYNAKNLTTVKFKYPNTEKYLATEFFVVNSRWQRNLDSDLVWTEPDIIENSLIFPGLEKWTQDDCVFTLKSKDYSEKYTYDDIVNKEGTDGSYSFESIGPLTKAYKINNGGEV